MSGIVSNVNMDCLKYYENKYSILFKKYILFKNYWSYMDVLYMEKQYTKGKVKEAREFIFFVLVNDYEIHVQGFNNTLTKYLNYDFNGITDKEEKHLILDNFLYDFEEYINLINSCIEKCNPKNLPFSKKTLNTAIASLKPQKYNPHENNIKVRSYEYDNFNDMINDSVDLFNKIFHAIKLEIQARQEL